MVHKLNQFGIKLYSVVLVKFMRTIFREAYSASITVWKICPPNPTPSVHTFRKYCLVIYIYSYTFRGGTERTLLLWNYGQRCFLKKGCSTCFRHQTIFLRELQSKEAYCGNFMTLPWASLTFSLRVGTLILQFTKSQNTTSSLTPCLRGSWTVWCGGDLTIFSLGGALDVEIQPRS